MKPTVSIQIDKSTCLSYNHSIDDFGYKGVPNRQCGMVAEEIENEYTVSVKVEVQATHTFNLNAQDAHYHSELKRQLKKQGVPKSRVDLKEKFNNAVSEISSGDIQKGFKRAYSRDMYGTDLVPQQIRDWDCSIESDFSVNIDIHQRSMTSLSWIKKNFTLFPKV